MNLPIPVPGATIGPEWAEDINNCLLIIDGHMHAPNYGVQVTPSGLNINADLTFNDNNATQLRTTRFMVQSAALGTASDIGCVYVTGVDLYFNDINGNQIQITQNGGVAGSPGSISNLTSPASASYVALSQTFVWQSDVNTPANMDAGSYIFRNITASSNGITVSAPNALGSNYTLTLPTLPATQSFMTLDASGNIAAPWTVDNSTIKIVANQLVAAAAGSFTFKANGKYRADTQIDDLFTFKAASTITSVWIQNQGNGSAGTTEFDLKVATTSGGSFTTILSTTGKVASTAAANVWTDTGSVIGVQTGVTKPVLSTTAMAAGSALRFDLLQAMTGGSNCSITVFYKEN